MLFMDITKIESTGGYIGIMLFIDVTKIELIIDSHIGIMLFI